LHPLERRGRPYRVADFYPAVWPAFILAITPIVAVQDIGATIA